MRAPPVARHIARWQGKMVRHTHTNGKTVLGSICMIEIRRQYIGVNVLGPSDDMLASGANMREPGANMLASGANTLTPGKNILAPGATILMHGKNILAPGANMLVLGANI